MKRFATLLALAVVAAGCGGSSHPGSTSASSSSANAIPRLDFSYDSSAPLRYVDHGRVNKRSYPIAIRDVSYQSRGKTVEAYLLLPPGSEKRPAVIFVHGSGGDRSELLAQAAWLAARNVVTLTITVPSSSVPGSPNTVSALLAQARSLTALDVVGVRRAVDVLQRRPTVDQKRIGYVGWSAGARLGTFVAASEPRVKALVLLSAGAAKLSEFVANAPVAVRPRVRRVLGSVDPIRYVGWARPGSLLLEDGKRDEVVPHAALVNIARAAPTGTVVRWYDTAHALDSKAYTDAFDWLTRKLSIDGPRVKGAVTG